MNSTSFGVAFCIANPVLTLIRQYGVNVNMVFLRATRYYFLLTNHSIHTIKGTEQNLINGLFENLKALDITGFSDFRILFPLNRSNRFRGDVIEDTVYA